jgi:tripartite-type tricarboxylate transporter receptor subunit TctC
MLMPRWFRCALAACGMVVLSALAQAQDFPSKTIKIIVPNPPGGAGDTSARLIGQKLSDILHQPVVVENQAGASGSIGMTMLKRAAPDGHTIGVVISLAQIIDRIQNKTASFDFIKDFTPITMIANNPVGFFVNSQITAPSMSEFIEYVRKRPGEVTYSSPGIGTAHHLYGEVLNKVAGIQMVNVPYKGVVPALNDLLGGHVQAGIISLSATLPHIQSGQIRALTLFDTKRHAKLTDVPIITEVVPNFELARSWVGFMAPPDLPPPITARLHGEIVRILNSAEIIQTLGASGLEVVANTPSEFAAIIRRDTRLWEEAAAAAGLVVSQ